MASQPVNIRDWSGKQAPGPLGPALRQFHSPWLMSGTHSPGLAKLLILEKALKSDSGKGLWPAGKTMEQTRDTNKSLKFCL